jgi:hypothetical protein
VAKIIGRSERKEINGKNSRRRRDVSKWKKRSTVQAEFRLEKVKGNWKGKTAVEIMQSE